MKHFILSAALLAATAPLAVGQATTWATDPMHSEVDFSIRHLGLTSVHGHFGKVTGTIQLNQADISRSSVQVSIDVTGVDTGEAPRDTHLKTPDFFDTAKYPTATFTSTSVAKSATGLTVTGNLTLHGVTKPVTLAVEGPEGPVTGLDKKPHTGYSATATINRADFGIGTKFPDAVLGNAVKLTIELDAAQQ